MNRYEKWISDFVEIYCDLCGIKIADINRAKSRIIMPVDICNTLIESGVLKNKGSVTFFENDIFYIRVVPGAKMEIKCTKQKSRKGKNYISCELPESQD